MGLRDNSHLSFLTWNIYLGADLTPAANGLTPAVVTQLFRQFLATNFPVRAKALARVIASKKPDLIGLQEAQLWEINIPTFGIVTYDFIELLLDELKERGLDYEVAALKRNRDLQNILDSNGNFIRFFSRDTILNRKESRLKIIQSQNKDFQSNPAGFKWGWSSVDVKLGRHVFRMINTHLEPVDSNIRKAQAMELINGPANTNLPVIITGDLNTIAGSTSYDIFVGAGFHDVWQEVGEGNGFTCCQGPDLLNAVSTLTGRIDYIMFKNGWNPVKAELVGESQNDRTKTGLWPSDHAGVFAKFKLEDPHHHYDEGCS